MASALTQTRVAGTAKSFKPALDLLLDSMHAGIWRVIVETVENGKM